jgi:AAA lid domain
MINGAGDWFGLAGRGQQVSRQLYRQLTEYREEQVAQIAVILTGQADPLLRWLHGYPQLTARFLAVIDFPGYAPGQLAAVFGKLTDEAGLRLTVAARRKAAVVLEEAEGGGGSGNARLAVRLLNEARAVQAHRVAHGSASDRDLAALVTITEHDIPDRLLPDAAARDDDRRGPYL